MTTIPIPTYLFDLEQLEQLRAQACEFMNTAGECDRALACVNALNAEIKARGHVPAVWDPCPPRWNVRRPHNPPKLRLVE